MVARSGQALLRLIVSANALNAGDVPVLIGLHVVDRDPGSLLAPAVGENGWAVVTTIERVLRSRLAEQVDAASVEEMANVELALRAALGLS